MVLYAYTVEVCDNSFNTVEVELFAHHWEAIEYEEKMKEKYDSNEYFVHTSAHEIRV